MFVALGEMGEHQQPRPALGRDAPGLTGGQVPVLARQRGIGVSEGGLTHHHVRAVGEGERAIAQPGIHDEREPLAPPRLAHLLMLTTLATHGQTSLALQQADVGAGDAQGGELARQHPPPVGLGQPVADSPHAVRQRLGLHPERRRLQLLVPSPMIGRSRRFVTSRNSAAWRSRVNTSWFLRRITGLHRVRHPVQRHPLQHARQAQAVIPVEMRDADTGDLAGGDPGEQHLPLGALTRVKQQPLAIPPQQVPIVVTAAGGRLARRPQNHQLPVGHGT